MTRVKVRDLEPGSRYGSLLVLYTFVETGRRWAKIKCDCGNEKQIRVGSIVAGCSRSCGNCHKLINTKPILLHHSSSNEVLLKTVSYSSKRTIIGGIYKIVSPTNKVYIGQSGDIENRFFTYMHLLCYKQYKLFNSLKKHTPDSHLFSIIHELPSDVSQNVINDYEQFYIDAYRDAGFNLLNIREGGSNGKIAESTKIKLRNANLGVPHSEERRQKLAQRNRERAKTPQGLLNCSNGGKANKGVKRSPEAIEKFRNTRPNSQPIICHTVEGIFVGEFRSQSECGRQLGMSQSGIWQVIKGIVKQQKGYTFKLK